MSPASSGALEIERYIGACLISSQQSRHKIKNHHHHYVPDLYPSGFVDGRYHQHPHANHNNLHFHHQHQQQQQRCAVNHSTDRWAGGLPLISYANHQRNNANSNNWTRRLDVDSRNPGQHHHQPQDCNNPLARLAVHTQGAPLILSHNRYRKNKPIVGNSATGSLAGKHTGVCGGKTDVIKANVNSGKCRENSVDTVSVASDESSGSANSETCLPRIIKPRKRRKKDRKPPVPVSHLSRPLSHDESFSTDSSSAATSPDIDAPLAHMPAVFVLPFNTCEDISSPLSPGSTISQYGGDEISETPNLHHSFEDVVVVEDDSDNTDINGNVESSCQCRYCDPSGQIWDIDRNCYSPFLTGPENIFRFPSLTAYATSMPISSSLPDHHPYLLDSFSTFSLNDEERDRNSVSVKSDGRSQRDLEVSTEIVTSLNGHRDLEIKFFSTNSRSQGIGGRDCDQVSRICVSGLSA